MVPAFIIFGDAQHLFPLTCADHASLAFGGGDELLVGACHVFHAVLGENPLVFFDDLHRGDILAAGQGAADIATAAHGGGLDQLGISLRRGEGGPRLLEALKLVVEKGRGLKLRVCIPAANGAAEREIRSIVESFKGLPPIEIQKGKARDLLRVADCAAVASGTATLEAALVRCPTVLVYAVGPVLAWFARRVIKGVRHVGLANVVAEKCGFESPMPELLQEDFTPDAVANQLDAWLSDSAVRSAAAKKLDDAMGYLQTEGEPLAIAADEIMSCLDERNQR